MVKIKTHFPKMIGKNRLKIKIVIDMDNDCVQRRGEAEIMAILQGFVKAFDYAVEHGQSSGPLFDNHGSTTGRFRYDFPLLK
jgi:hypothetical protein